MLLFAILHVTQHRNTGATFTLPHQLTFPLPAVPRACVVAESEDEKKKKLFVADGNRIGASWFREETNYEVRGTRIGKLSLGVHFCHIVP